MPPVQAPAAHASITEQNSPSSQGMPLAPGASLTHASVTSLQLSSVQPLASSHERVVPPVHVPVALQASLTVQNWPSSQGEPDAAAASCTQTSVASLHESTVHWFVSEQSRGTLTVHAPPEHVSVTVQNWPSLQDVPLG
jgi:hypothetical protein